MREAGWGSGRGGAQTGPGKVPGTQKLLQKLLPALQGRPGAPATPATMGNPSDGEMGRLLTREIKSGRDREYLYAHLRTPREDASSQGSAAKSHFPDSGLERIFCSGSREDNRALTRSRPPGSPSCRPAPRGGARRPPLCCHSCPAGRLPGLRGNEQNLTFSSLGLIYSPAKPLL